MMTNVEAPSREQYQRALGQVLLALRGHDVFAGEVQNLDYWRTLDGHIDIDWADGPFPSEAVAALTETAADPELGELQSAELVEGDTSDTIWINSVRVRFRPYAPVGAAESLRRVTQRHHE